MTQAPTPTPPLGPTGSGPEVPTLTPPDQIRRLRVFPWLVGPVLMVLGMLGLYVDQLWMMPVLLVCYCVASIGFPLRIMPRITADEAGLTVHDVLRTRRIGWGAITAVSAEGTRVTIHIDHGEGDASVVLVASAQGRRLVTGSNDAAVVAALIDQRRIVEASSDTRCTVRVSATVVALTVAVVGALAGVALGNVLS